MNKYESKYYSKLKYHTYTIMNISCQIFDMNIICEEYSQIYLNIRMFATLFNKVVVDIVKMVFI